MTESLLGMPLSVYVGFTVIVAGGAAWFSGRALALGWRPTWMVVPTALGLALADRFFVWALFGGEFYPVAGTLSEFATLLFLGLLAHRYTRVRRMVRQYPWLYESNGPLMWRPLSQNPDSKLPGRGIISD